MAFNFPKSICRFCRQHRRKFIFVGVFAGSVYGVIKFAEYKIKSHISQEHQKANEKLKIQKSFEQVKQHSFSIVSAMLNEAMQSIKHAVDTEEITEKLKTGQGNKMILWQELKISIFTRVVTGVSTVVLTLLVLQVQLNQIAGLMAFSDSVEPKLDPQQQQFLSLLYNHIVNCGIYDLANTVKKVVADQLESMPLQAMYCARDLETTLISICSALFQNSTGLQKQSVKLCQFAIADSLNLEGWTVIPTTNMTVVEQWLGKTADILESPDFQTVSFSCIKTGLSSIGRELNFAISSVASATTHSFVESQELIAPLAKLLPILNGQLSLICSEQFLKDIADNSTLNKFLLNVFQSFTVIDNL